MPTTARVLGGCPLGKTSEDGLVDRGSRVFGYDGLYVMDNSVIGANLGVNPRLTITALADTPLRASRPRRPSDPTRLRPAIFQRVSSEGIRSPACYYLCFDRTTRASLGGCRDEAESAADPGADLRPHHLRPGALGHSRRPGGYHYHDVIRALQQIQPDRIAAAILLTVLGYLVLTVSTRLPSITSSLHGLRTDRLVSFIGYAFSNNAGFNLFTTAPVRYRLYSAWVSRRWSSPTW